MDDLYDEYEVSPCFECSKADKMCRFGNFIGEAEESEDDSQHGVDVGAYLDDDYPEEAPEATGQELMEVDGLS